MGSCSGNKLTGLNAWFIIEILSFYGYIISAAIFMMIKVMKSSFGYHLFNQKHERVINAYKFDFIAFYRKDLDWIAFVTILLNVNIGLIMIDNYIIFVPENKNVDLKTAKFPLKHV